MLSTLITNKTRIKLLVKFFLNPGTRSYLRSLATEFNESTNAIRLELNKFEDRIVKQLSTDSDINTEQSGSFSKNEMIGLSSFRF